MCATGLQPSSIILCVDRYAKRVYALLMTLDEHRKREKMSDQKLADLVGRSRETVWHWRHGTKLPGKDSLRAIFAATNGQVTANDFFHPAVAEAKPEGAAA